jgi:mannose-6-phosphate isomerase-like protein (cupin superfamily)
VVEWGEFTAYFERITAGTDYSPSYESCDCPHLGYVFKGKIRFVYKDGRDEVVTAGEMYYAPPGHTFAVLEDAETVEFSPTGPYRRHMETVSRNMAALRSQR